MTILYKSNHSVQMDLANIFDDIKIYEVLGINPEDSQRKANDYVMHVCQWQRQFPSPGFI